jgi:nitroimidazol reductase NimA-like FMN-containing flavoprotein (pyridoxamine 5'-phosphate oxidase superfamily)
MQETAEDLRALRALLDQSYVAAGSHLLGIHRPKRRLSADQVSERLNGMCLLALATATADGRPIVGPVDGIFFRGSFYFGSAPDSVRIRHIRRRPHVNATHAPSEALAVTVHGQARPVDVAALEHAAFRRTLLDIYIPRYGQEWEKFLDSGSVYARIDARRMFAFHTPEPG